jgi:RNA recognition motif-containing protein
MQINKEKRQAFVEFLTPEDATAALSFNGRPFSGSALKIRRPKEYIEMPVRSPYLSHLFFSVDGYTFSINCLRVDLILMILNIKFPVVFAATICQLFHFYLMIF